LKVGGEKQTNKRILSGQVVSISGNKSILVEVERRVQHSMYGKTITKKKKFMVHDENNRAKVGDFVKFIECKPISKRKRWKLLELEKEKIG
jgi:small subunit ribosomal protein S17